MKTDRQLERQARALYQNAARQLDASTAARLRAARRDALAGNGRASTTHRTLRLVLLPAGAFAVIALAVAMVWQPQRAATPETAAQAAATQAVDDADLPPDPASADPGLYKNLDFYSWMASADAQNPSSPANPPESPTQ